MYLKLKNYRYEGYEDFTAYKIYEIIYKRGSHNSSFPDECLISVKGICLPKKIEGYLCLFEIREDKEEDGSVKDRYLSDWILIRIKDIVNFKELNKSILYFCNQNDDRLSEKNKDLARKIFCMYSENKIA